MKHIAAFLKAELLWRRVPRLERKVARNTVVLFIYFIAFITYALIPSRPPQVVEDTNSISPQSPLFTVPLAPVTPVVGGTAF